MKKVLLLALFAAPRMAQAQAGPSVISEIMVATDQHRKPYAGYFFFFNQTLNEKKQTGGVSLTGIVFTESKIGEDFSLIAGVGPSLTGKNWSLGAMFTFANNTDMFAITPWGYIESNDGNWSAFGFITAQKGKAEYMFEGLKLFKLPHTDLKLGIGALNLRDYAGPYVRISGKKAYFGINPAIRCLPNLHWEDHPKTERIERAGEQPARWVIQFLAGLEIPHRGE